MAVTGTTLRVDNLRGYAQGEIFLLKKAGEHLEATVYNSTGFGPVPALNSTPSTWSAWPPRPKRTWPGRTPGATG